MSVDLELRKELPEEALVFDHFAYDDAIIGVSSDGRAVYDYEMMINDLVVNEEFTYEEAAEWIDYNTVRSIPYCGQHAPIIMYPIVRID